MAPKIVLIVDDTKNVRDIVGFMVRNRGYDVLLAKDGDEGYRLATTAQPDLIVLDVMMPGKSGFDICSELKRSEKFRHIPIILLTAVAKGTGLSDQDMIRKTGADGCLSKPFQSKELFARIQKLLEG